MRTGGTGDGVAVEVAGFILVIIHQVSLQHVGGDRDLIDQVFAPCEWDAL